LRQGQPGALETALKTIGDEHADPKQRLEYIEILGEIKQPVCVPALLKALGYAADDALRKASLTALQAYDDPRIGAQVVALYNSLSNEVRTVAQTALASRASWALQWARAIESGQIKPEAVPANVVRNLRRLKEPELARLAEKIWGRDGIPTTAEMEKSIQRLAQVVRSGAGDPYHGQTLFNTTCAACHTLFNQGGQVGPDLTTYKRDDLETILLNVVNPNAEIREGFENYVIETKDDRTLNGFLVESDNRVVVLRGLDGQNLTLDRKDIVEMKAAGVSLMPEGLLDTFDDQQVRDLFAYLRSTQPLVK
jgi:putative heme-binding domain-containing protein